MALPVPKKLDGGRAIVMEDVPPGTGIGDLIGAFSPFGAIRFASVGPPAVVSFESEASAARALLVASMKSVSLLGAFRDKTLQVPSPAQPANHHSGGATAAPLLRASPETVEIGPYKMSPAEAAAHGTKMCQVEAATAASPAEAAAPKTKSSPDEAAMAMLVSASDGLILEFKKLERYMDDIVQIQDQLAELLIRGSDIRVQSTVHSQSYRRGRIAAEAATRGLNTKRDLTCHGGAPVSLKL